MEKRRFGRTGHLSTVAIFGGAAFWDVDQVEADRAMELVISHGVNHIDVAPSYGKAELRLGPWLAGQRDRFFVGCKTMERTKEGAKAELRRSLEKLQTDHFDLYQIHAITKMEELDAVTAPGGALEALIEARQEGLTRFLGITGHGADTPAIFLEALQRFDFDTVLFPINFVQYTDPKFRRDAGELLAACKARDAGTMIIKSIAKGPWGEKEKSYTTWYEPFDDMEMIQPAVDFVLSQDVTGICTSGDTHLLPLLLQACENFKPMPQAEQEALIEKGGEFSTIFV
jgi:aryl-alcohol dehydrogenase-like predicted oxidoreductase